MFNRSSLLTTLLLALSISASPVIQIRDSITQFPFSLKLNLSSTVTIADTDRSRAEELIRAGKHRAEEFQKYHPVDAHAQQQSNGTDFQNARARTASSISATNAAVTYTTNVGVGNGQYTLLIDTGSSNTWVGAGKAYAPSSASKNTGKQVAVSYGSGSFSGTEYTDTVALSSSLTINQQSIGVASSARGFNGVDGILGIGPTDLTYGTVTGSYTVPTVADNLYSQGTIPTEVIGISYNPTTAYSSTNGELTFGGVDASKYTGGITYAPITGTSPSNQYWGIDQTVTYGASGKTTVLATTAGIVDTGTTLILLAPNAYNNYAAATGATLDMTTGLLSITPANYAKLQSLFFTIGGTKFELTANAQTWPRSLNSAIGGSAAGIYLVVNNLGSSGQGLDFINGYTFLERFYSVFDTTGNRVGLATTPNTQATTN